MDLHKTALLLIGFQNDYFSPNGILHGVIEEQLKVNRVLENTLELVNVLKDSPVLMVSTPIVFTDNYEELIQPIGILKTIKEVKAFHADSEGSKTIPEILAFGDRIEEVKGKRGLNAFSNTALDDLFEQHGIENLILAGVVTSICIDSTGRAAFEKGYQVYVLSDCTSGRTKTEQEFYCQNIFPLYGNVVSRRYFTEEKAAAV